MFTVTSRESNDALNNSSSSFPLKSTTSSSRPTRASRRVVSGTVEHSIIKVNNTNGGWDSPSNLSSVPMLVVGTHCDLLTVKSDQCEIANEFNAEWMNLSLIGGGQHQSFMSTGSAGSCGEVWQKFLDRTVQQRHFMHAAASAASETGAIFQ